MYLPAFYCLILLGYGIIDLWCEMRKIKYLIQRIFGMNYKGFFKMVKEVHKKTGKSSLYVFFDIIRCGLKYQAGYVDYNLFEMYKMNDEERKTVITRGRNNEFVKNYNNPAYLKYFVDKVEFHKKFSKYINREWLDLNNSNKRVSSGCKSKTKLKLFVLGTKSYSLNPKVVCNEKELLK